MICWLVCPSFPDYEVSEFGDVRRCELDRKGHIHPDNLKPRLVRGYCQYGISVNGKDKKVYAHLLVLEAFIGPKPFDTAEGCHNDGSKTNNHYRNLRWDTPAANQADRHIHGTALVGEKHPSAKLTEDQVRRIRELICIGQSQRQIAREFNISQSAVSNINSNTNWSHV